MKKIILILVVIFALFFSSCRETTENISSELSNQIFDNSKTISDSNIADKKHIEAELKDYFFNNYSSNDIGILADVTSDYIVDLITVKKSDNRIIGRVYTFVNDQIKCIEEKTGGNDHASLFFNWYLKKNDFTYSLVEENDGIWQGIGTCETNVYTLTNDGKRIIDREITVSSKNNNPISDSDFKKYSESISDIIGNSYEILYVSTQSKKKPNKIDDNLLIKIENSFDDNSSALIKNSSESEISSHPKTNNKDIQVLELGRYEGKLDFQDNNYAYITLQSDNTFTLDANFELNNFKGTSPFVRQGNYKIETSNNVNWISLYFNNEFYWTYAIVDNKTFQDQAIVFGYLS